MKQENKTTVDYSIRIDVLELDVNCPTNDKNIHEIFDRVVDRSFKNLGLESSTFTHELKFGFGKEFDNCFHETTHYFEWEVVFYTEDQINSVKTFVSELSIEMGIDKSCFYVRKLTHIDIN